MRGKGCIFAGSGYGEVDDEVSDMLYVLLSGIYADRACFDGVCALCQAQDARERVATVGQVGKGVYCA